MWRCAKIFAPKFAIIVEWSLSKDRKFLWQRQSDYHFSNYVHVLHAPPQASLLFWYPSLPFFFPLRFLTLQLLLDQLAIQTKLISNSFTLASNQEYPKLFNVLLRVGFSLCDANFLMGHRFSIKIRIEICFSMELDLCLCQGMCSFLWAIM